MNDNGPEAGLGDVVGDGEVVGVGDGLVLAVGVGVGVGLGDPQCFERQVVGLAATAT